MKSESWVPPDDPDPSAILHEGVSDTRAGRYATALSKFVWFYEHSLEYDAALGAVRLSFALGYWFDLARKYPPARDALCKARDRAQDRCERSSYEFDHFHEFASINRVLGEGTRTVKTFQQICNSAPEAARRNYHVAEPFLIEVGAYATCAPFLDPTSRVALAADVFAQNQRFEKSQRAGRIPTPSFAREHFTLSIATLVALLVLNDRSSEAKEACAQALETLDGPQFRELLDAALTGHLPKPRWS
jgi:hypothetical protein